MKFTLEIELDELPENTPLLPLIDINLQRRQFTDIRQVQQGRIIHRGNE